MPGSSTAKSTTRLHVVGFRVNSTRKTKLDILLATNGLTLQDFMSGVIDHVTVIAPDSPFVKKLIENAVAIRDSLE